LYSVGALLVGNEKSRQQFAGKTTRSQLRVYATTALVFGVLIFISSFVYLFTTVL
jgi:hypothetical protein